MGCLSGCLVSSASVQKLFCGICSVFNWFFDEFVGGESDLPVLVLCHLRTTPSICVSNTRTSESANMLYYQVGSESVSRSVVPGSWNPADFCLPDSFVHGILQAKLLEGIVIPFSRGSSQSRDQTHISCLSCNGKQVLYQVNHHGSPKLGRFTEHLFSFFLTEWRIL